jgi:hypothetical protein
MMSRGLGANEFIFVGDRTQISYLTQSPGPIHPGEGSRVTIHSPGKKFTGKKVRSERYSPLCSHCGATPEDSR